MEYDENTRTRFMRKLSTAERKTMETCECCCAYAPKQCWNHGGNCTNCAVENIDPNFVKILPE